MNVPIRVKGYQPMALHNRYSLRGDRRTRGAVAELA
jgi:hypothetical protein